MNKIKNKKLQKSIISLVAVLCVGIAAFLGFGSADVFDNFGNSTTSSIVQELSFDLSEIPKYTDEPYVIINHNKPDFDEDDYTTVAFETYTELDDLGRCGIACANLCQELMPTEDRDDISEIEPSGWVQAEYNGEYLYNRCHLIGHQLAGEDANEKNLITGTRYLNIEGMLPFENEIADYIEETDNHVLYRVTPIFEGDNLVASGIQLEAFSVEDEGDGIEFNVYCYNVQPGVEINYETGKSKEVN